MFKLPNDEIEPFPDDELALKFLYKHPPTDTHFELIKHMKAYIKDYHKWCKKSMHEPSIRARNHLLEIHKLSRILRKEILEERP